jgi:predicted phosphodiesterase
MQSRLRLALISDIHANLPALEATLDHIARDAAVDAIYHLGDLVGYGPWPNETVDLLRRRGITGVAGNYDSTVATNYKHCGCKSESPREEALAHESFTWTLANTTVETKRFLNLLPFRLDVVAGGGHSSGPRLVLVHGTPVLNTTYWTADRSDAFCLKMAEIAGMKTGDSIAFGHTHLPWHREVSGMHFINTGSVGRPKDGDWRAGYVVLELGDAVKPDFVRIPYDVDRAAAGIEGSELPNEFADDLRTGYAVGAVT